MNLVFSIVAFALLTVFLGILFVSVPSPDLVIVCLVAIAMCGYDFYKSIQSKEQH